MAVSSSRPLITGICTSAITHDVSFKWADRKNSSADANVWTVCPSDLTRLFVAARTEASSSITEMTESVDKTGLPDAGQGAGRRTAAPSKSGPRIKIVKSYLGLYPRGLGRTNSGVFALPHQIGQRPRAHFFHDVSAMDLHGNLGKPNLGCHVFGHEPETAQSQNLPLA